MTKEESQKIIDESGIRAGQFWRHYKGTTYLVIATALDEATLAPMVVYESPFNERGSRDVWIRSIEDFLAQTKYGPRFVRESP